MIIQRCPENNYATSKRKKLYVRHNVWTIIINISQAFQFYYNLKVYYCEMQVFFHSFSQEDIKKKSK